MRRALPVALSALLLTPSACARSGGGDQPRPSDSPVSVEVTNQHALPMEIYALGSGITHRLGTVHPGMAGHFRVPQNLISSSSVRFEARPSGVGRPFQSGELLLSPGAVVDFVISPQLFNSTVTQRP